MKASNCRAGLGLALLLLVSIVTTTFGSPPAIQPAGPVPLPGQTTAPAGLDAAGWPSDLCQIECDPCAIPEGEPECHDDYLDTYNAGCGMEGPPVFTPIELGDTFCGTSGTFWYHGYEGWDTDWYSLTQSQDGPVCLTGVAEFPVMFLIIDAGPGGCEYMEFLDYRLAEPCQTVQLATYLPAGYYFVWVGPTVFTDIPCGARYQFSLAGPAAGDLNCDGSVNNFDITAFVLALTATRPGYAEYYAEYPGCDHMLGDVNGDGRVDNFDISPFVELLVGSE